MRMLVENSDAMAWAPEPQTRLTINQNGGGMLKPTQHDAVTCGHNLASPKMTLDPFEEVVH